MKITVTGGVVRAQAESIGDVKMLLGLKEKPEARRKHKRKVPCPICNKMVKGLKLHTTLAH